jgi:nucleoside-diphosphate-sugar epimerase
MKICVTGGAGLIGQPVVKKLVQAGHKVTILDIVQCNIPGCTYVLTDITNYKDMEAALKGQDMVFHIAGSVLESTRKNPPVAMDISIVGTANVLQACIKNNIGKIVFASSASIYHGIAESRTVDESMISHPFEAELLGTVKMLCEKLIYEYTTNARLSYVILRIGPVFGASERCTSIICDFIKAGTKKQIFSIWGDGRRLLQPTYVEDVAEGFLFAMDSKNEIYNLISPDRYSIREIAQLFRENFGFDYKLEPDRPGGQTYPYISSRKLQNTGWKHTSFIDAVSRIIEEKRHG